jgi:hypothetical protein
MSKIIVKNTASIILIIYVLLFMVFKKPYEEWDRVINSDGKGYYGYLTAIFIYHDLDYKFIESYEKEYYPSDRSVFKDFRYSFKGETVNKYFPGLAILWLPFFILAHFLSYLLGFPTDGYSIIYQYSIALATLFYLWIGLKFLQKLLIRFSAKDTTASFITFTIAFGTNIIYYAIVEPSMAHIYSFALITGFIYFSIRAIEEDRTKWYLLATLCYGLTIIIRPTNGIFIFIIPFLAGSAAKFTGFINRFINNSKSLFYSLLTFTLILLIPPLIWHTQTGYFFVYTYGAEGFDFLHPHFFEILFSYNKGWFIYTPIAFVSLFGFAGLFKENKFKSTVLALLLIIHIYITSCWWVWDYTSKFSQRVFIDFYAIVGILLFYLFKLVEWKPILRKLLTLIIVLMIGMNLFQFYQHSKWVFPFGHITKEIYWDSFFRIVPRAKVYIPEEEIAGIKTVEHNFETQKGWNNEDKIVDLNGNKVIRIDSANIYSVEFREWFVPYFSTSNRIIKVSADILSDLKKSESVLIVEFQAGNITYSYNPFYPGAYNIKDKWTHVEFAIYTPEPITNEDFVKVFFFDGSGKEKLYVDNLKIEFISMKEQAELLDGIDKPEMKFKKIVTFGNNLEKDIGWKNYKSVCNEKAHSGRKSSKVGGSSPYSISFEKELQDFYDVEKLYIAVHAYIYSDIILTNPRIIVSFLSDGKLKEYKAFFFSDKVVPEQWTLVEYVLPVPQPVSQFEIMKVYIWNPAQNEVIFADDIKIDFFSLKE